LGKAQGGDSGTSSSDKRGKTNESPAFGTGKKGVRGRKSKKEEKDDASETKEKSERRSQGQKDVFMSKGS